MNCSVPSSSGTHPLPAVHVRPCVLDSALLPFPSKGTQACTSALWWLLSDDVRGCRVQGVGWRSAVPRRLKQA